MIPFQCKLQNTTETPMDCNVEFQTPDFLKNNLDKKRMYVSSLFLNNTSLPTFIPIIGSQSFITETMNKIPDAGSGFVNYIFNQSFGVNSLKYYVAVRDPTHDLTILYFIDTIEQNNQPKPPMPYSSNNNAMNDKYYWYNDFSVFLKLLEYGLNVCLQQINLQTNISVPIPQFCFLTNDGKSLSMYVDSLLSFNCDIHFSEELIKILPFPNYKDGDLNLGHIISKSEILTKISGTDYALSNCQFSDNIYPIESIVFISRELPIMYKQYNTNLVVQNTNYNKVFLEFYPEETNNLISLYTPYQYSVKTPVPYLYFTQNNFEEYNCSFSCYARLKNDTLILCQLNYGERFIINFYMELIE